MITLENFCRQKKLDQHYKYNSKLFHPKKKILKDLEIEFLTTRFISPLYLYIQKEKFVPGVSDDINFWKKLYEDIIFCKDLCHLLHNEFLVSRIILI